MSQAQNDTASPATAARDDEINLLEYWQILRERQWLIAAVAGGVLLLTLAVTLLTTPIFRAGTTLQIERDTMKVVDFEGLTPLEAAGDRDFYQTQYELLKSRALALRVIQDLRLTEHAQFAERMEAMTEEAGEGAAPSQLDRERALVGAMLDALTIEPVRNSRLVKINFDSPDPQLAARVANAWAAGFIASNLERRFQATSYASKYLEERLAQLKARLEDSEKELVAFSAQEQIVSVGEGAPSLSAQNLAELNRALATAQQERIKTESLWRQASAGNGLGLPQVVGNQLIQRLREQRAMLAAEYQQKLTTYKPDYPDMQRLGNQIAEADQQIATEIGNIRAAIQADYDSARAQEELLQARIDRLKGEVLDLQDRSIQYNILRREAETNRQLYDGLLQRYKEIGVAGGVGANNISVVDRAEVPGGKYSPRLSRNLAIGLLLGGFAGVLLAFVLHYLDRAVHTPKQLETLVHRPVLGVIPLLPAGQTPAQATTDARSAFAEAYRSVRTALQFATPHGLPRTLFVTSTGPGEGKSTSAAELARNIAQLGKRVLLVDADLRDPSLHRTLDVSNAIGLSSLLTGAADLEQAIQVQASAGFDLIPSGPLPPSPPELLASERLPALLQALGERYDAIILDGPPVLGLADAPLLAHHVEATLLVAAAGDTHGEALVQSAKRLRAAHAQLLGTLLTRHDPRHKGEGYGYTYYQYGGGKK